MTIPGGYVAGDVLTAANMNLLPGGRMAGASTTSSQTGIGTSFTDLTTLTCTFTAVASRRYKISYTVGCRQITSDGLITIAILRGASVLTTAEHNFVTSQFRTCVSFFTEVPGAGSVTYKLQAKTSANTLNVNGGAGTEVSAILVEDIGV
jgi:hypothetical protein